MLGNRSMNRGVDVQPWVSAVPACVDASDTLRDAIGILHERGIGIVPVLEGERLVGVFSGRDLVRSAASSSKVDESRLVADVMTRGPITAQVEDEYEAVHRLMEANGVSYIPVLAGERLVGIASICDLQSHHTHHRYGELSEAGEHIDTAKSERPRKAIEAMSAEVRRYAELSLTDHLTACTTGDISPAALPKRPPVHSGTMRL